VRFLSKEDRDWLIAAYSPHIQPIITMLAFQGPRIQTALQIPWGIDGIDMKERSIRLNHSKNAVIKSVQMHPRLFDALEPIWEKRGQPTKGHVFLNRFGKPNSDTRKSNISRRQPD
jgi:hypothetical protein